MEFAQAAFLVAGALAGGIVNGLTGFGTAITALGIWVYAIPPTDASSAPPANEAPLPAEQAAATDPADGLPGLMVPPGAGR